MASRGSSEPALPLARRVALGGSLPMTAAGDSRADTGHEPGKDPLLPALGKLVRGLSCLFWGVPILLVASVQTAKAEPARNLHLWSTVGAFALVAYGVHLLGAFQPQERIWQRAVDRARLVSLLNLGFSPFLYYWSRVPSNGMFQSMLDLLVVCFLSFLIEMNPLMERLVAMLPDAALRDETKLFARIGRAILAPIWGGAVFYLVMTRFNLVFPFLAPWFAFLSEGGLWIALFLALLPIALTMSLLWKIKELVFQSVFCR
ncbi:MAG: hypothetical protein HYR88_06005 [Verrucomicrobia bacterium]|nr:hypothetical protein [Verrucomicrobiota bacterium]MBI3867672.1 hypothetical protein [Verrucomicrobiota bacterium]